jgi:hypothetical protein
MQFRAAVFTSLLVGITAVPAAASQACAVTGLEGDQARVQRDGLWFEIEQGALPGSAEAVETGAATRLEITCDDGTVLTVGPDSSIVLADLLERPEESIVLRLLGGIVGLVVPPHDGDVFAVQTPVAIASVRSTEWLIEHAPTGQTAVFVREGSVAVANDVENVVLDRGEGVTLDRNAVVKPVGAWGAARLAQVNSALGFGWE